MTNCRGIKLNKGKVAMVDAADYEWLSQWKWHVTDKGYAARSARKEDGQASAVLMHRVILNTPKGMYTDHIDGNKLNNRRSNLRICTVDENNRNFPPRLNCTSKYKGVTWHKRSGKWQARVKSEKTIYHLGLYELEMDAAHAYNVFALEKFGQFALLNPVPADWVITTKNIPKKFNNLRIAKQRKNAASPYKGVTRQHKKWRAAIKVDGKPRYLGAFETQEEAARAYNAAAYAAWGDMAYLNPIPEQPRRGPND